MAGEGIFQSKKNVVVALRFLVFASLVVILKYHEIKSLPGWLVTATLIILVGSNIWLIAMPKARFKSQMLYGWVFIGDLAMVTFLMIAVAGNRVEFYAVFVPYIATIVYTALTRRLSSAFLVVFMAALVYGVFIIMAGKGSELLGTPFLTWIIVFFLTAFFVGYLAEEIKREIELSEKLKRTEKVADEAMHKLGELRSLHELVTESVPDGIVVIDENLAVEYANPRFAKILGVQRSEIEGARIGTLVCERDACQHRLRNLLAAAMQEKKATQPDEFSVEDAQGQKRTFSCRVYPLALGGARLRMVAILEDVTDKRNAEAQRLERMRAESHFKILSSLSGAMSSLGSFRQIISRFASATEPILSFTACATLELDKEPLTIDYHLTAKVGREFLERLRDRMRLSLTQLVPEFPAQKDISFELDEEMVSEKESAGMESFLAVPVIVDSETVALIGFASTVAGAFKPQDISFAYTLANYYSLILSRAKIEEEMLRREVDDELQQERLKLEAARRQAEIEATRTSLEAERRAVRELKRVDELKSEFITTVSHEMRTPMTSIKSSMDLLLSGRLGEVQKEHRPFLEIAVRNINRLAQLLDDVLNVSRIESGRAKMAPGVYELKPIVGNVISTLETRLKEASTSVDDRVPDELTAYFDRNSLTQIFTNLIANAVNHNKPGVRVTISVVSGKDGFVTVSVANDGAGIPEDEREKIFERFYQSGRTFGEGSKGTGLGLTISRGLVKAMGGTMWVEGGDDTGADFRFTLPLTREALGKPKGPPAALESELDSALLFGRIAVLMKFATQEQVNECARKQGEKTSAKRLGEILIEKDYMSAGQRDMVLHVQQANLDRPSTHDPDKKLADTILGGLAVSRGLLREEQVNECLREQALLESEGKPVLLGELLVKRGHLKIAQILELLAQQKTGQAGVQASSDSGKQGVHEDKGNS